MPLQRHTSLQISGWIFVLAGLANVAASFLSKSALFAVAGGCMFFAAIFFFIVSRKVRDQSRKEPRD